MKIVINTCFGGFSVSSRAKVMLGLHPGVDDESLRCDPRLIAAIEAHGSEAMSGPHSELRVVAIPDDVHWHIHNYDGVETIHEDHRSWG
jgi:hypothetical protein